MIQSASENDKKHPWMAQWVKDLIMLFERGRMLDERDETIDKWMERDRKIDQMYDEAEPFYDIRCKKCLVFLKPESWSATYFSAREVDWKDRMWFFYKCPECNKKSLFYDNREEYIFEKPKCEKCNGVVSEKTKREWDIITTISTCQNCWNKTKDVLDLDTSGEKKKQREKEENDKYSHEDFEKYGFNEKDRSDYVSQMKALDNLKEIMDDKDSSNIAEELSRIIKLTLPKVIAKLKEKLDEKKYSDLISTWNSIEKTYIRVSFSMNYLSEENFNTSKFIRGVEDLFIDTNWRICKNSVVERLWIVTFDLFGYDNRDDLIKLVEKKVGKQDKRKKDIKFYKGKN